MAERGKYRTQKKEPGVEMMDMTNEYAKNNFTFVKRVCGKNQIKDS